MLAIVHADILFEQVESIRWGSPVDTGGFAAGYYGTDAQQLAEIARLRSGEFLSLLAEIAGLDIWDRRAWANHRITPKVAAIMTKYLDSDLMKLLEAFDAKRYLYCEVCLSGDIAFRPDQVVALYCPNTYEALLKERGVQENLYEKVRYYNPLLGIESVDLHALGLDRNF